MNTNEYPCMNMTERILDPKCFFLEIHNLVGDITVMPTLLKTPQLKPGITQPAL